MTTEVFGRASAAPSTRSGLLARVAGAAALGLGLIVLAGHVQGATLHDAAHDMRHATGFPCH